MLTVEVPLIRLRRGLSIRFASQEPPKAPPKATEVARALALGHRIVQMVESGRIRDYTEASRRMNVSLPRVSVLVTLTFLAPAIQEDLLLGKPRPADRNFKRLCAIARVPSWSEQVLRYWQPCSPSLVPREPFGPEVSEP